MKSLKQFTKLLICLSLFVTVTANAEESIRQRIEAWNAGYQADILGCTIQNQSLLEDLYLESSYQPFWLEEGHPGASALNLIGIISRVDEDGLQPDDYHAGVLLDMLLQNEQSVPVETDILLSDAFLLLARHLLMGKINPESLAPDWRNNGRDIDMRAIWYRFVSGEPVDTIIDNLRPNQVRYKRLKAALANLKAHRAVNWQKLSPSPAIRPLTSDSRIPSIREKLKWWNDMDREAGVNATDTANILISGENNENIESDFYDVDLKRAIESFQYRHGLDTDGIIGPATFSALNRSPEERIGDIMVNLERWRWLDKDFGKRFMVVNIADFDLRIYDNNEVVFQKPVIVGRNYRKTPVFSDQIKYIVFNPTWTVPHKLAVVDKLPEIKKDPGYLNRMGFRVYQMGTSNPIEASGVDWDKVNKNNFPYRIVQGPGPLNALGLVKFMFPNPYDVYLHDTPSRELFTKSERAFSSGCVRVADPLELALYLLSPQGWDQDRIDTVVQKGETTTVYLEKPMPIHIEYWTAWVNREGVLNFRNDVYRRDPAVLSALMSKQ